MNGEFKLQYHARKFFECSDPGRVLARYAKKAETFSIPDLGRHMCHVCAWVALAQPPQSAAYPAGPGGLSAVSLLVKMLRLRRDNSKIYPRLRSALGAVKSVCLASLASSPPARHDCWRDLLHTMPRLGKLKRRGPTDGELSINLEDDAVFKRARLLNKSVLRWAVQNGHQANTALTDLEVELRNVTANAEVDTVGLRKILYNVIGALSPPRVASQCKVGVVPLDDLSAERLRKAAIMQKCVRRILIKALKQWRCVCYLEDEQIEPILNRVRWLVENFERSHGNVCLSCSGRQWHRLKLVVGVGQVEALLKAPRRLASTRRHSLQNLTIFEPSAASRQCGSVTHCPEEARDLACEKCAHVVSSSWYFKNPNSGKRYVIKPTDHARCRSANAAKPRYFAVDGFPSTVDTAGNFNYCTHGRRAKECQTCNAYRLCVHGRVPQRCAVCKPPQRTYHRPR